MVRHITIVLLVTIIGHLCNAQDFSVLNPQIYPLNSIDTANENYDDIEFLKDIIRDNKLVLLGEQEHGVN